MKTWIVVLLGLGILPGCLMTAGAVTGGGAVTREYLDESVVYDATGDEAEGAVQKAIVDMGGNIITVKADRSKGAAAYRTFRGKTYDAEALTIDIEPQTPKTTRIDVRVGRIGDKQRARDIHRAIQKYLPSFQFK